MRRRSSKTLIPMLALSLALAACGGSSKSSSSTTPASAAASSNSAPAADGQSAHVVSSAANASLGATVLVDAQGMTLYRLSGEEHGRFICTSATCVASWHPLIAPTVGVSGTSVGSLGIVKRPEGSEQVTYKGLPLYTFVGDKAPGEANGQGLKDVGVWSAISPGSTGVSTSTASAGSEGSGESGYRY